MPRYAARVDGNHREIVKALRQIGCSVLNLAPVGEGCPDLLIGFRGANYLLEVKTARGQTNARQRAFKQAWRGHYAVVRSVDEAYGAIGVLVDKQSLPEWAASRAGRKVIAALGG